MLTSKKTPQQSNASARVVDGKMILSLPDAISPIVWQMDLNQAQASAFEVTSDDDNTQYMLSLKASGGKDTKKDSDKGTEIAKFDNREYAVEGLMAASAALENAGGKIHAQYAPQNNAPASVSEQHSNHAVQQPDYKIQPPSSGSVRGTVLKVFLALAALIIMFTLWSMSQTPIISAAGGLAPTAASTGAETRAIGGVPVSADDFLRQ